MSCNLCAGTAMCPMSSSWESKKYWHNIVSRRRDYNWSASSVRLIVPIMGLNWWIAHRKRCLEEQSQNLWSNVSHFTEQLNTELLCVSLTKPWQMSAVGMFWKQIWYVFRISISCCRSQAIVPIQPRRSSALLWDVGIYRPDSCLSW